MQGERLMASRRPTTYDVRIWAVQKITSKGQKSSGKVGKAAGQKGGTTYRLRWVVAGHTWSANYATAALAESKRSELLAAARRGEAFDVGTGLPVSLVPVDQTTVSWWEWALTYVDMKWSSLAPKSRLSMAEALTTATMALLSSDRDRPPADQLRSAMLQWAFVRRAAAGTGSDLVPAEQSGTRPRTVELALARRAASPPPSNLADAVEWLSRSTLPLTDLEDAPVARSVLDALALKLDGKPAAATTVARKRAVLYNAVELAVEQGLLSANSFTRVRWRAPKLTEAIDPAAAVNSDQARDLLAAVRLVGQARTDEPTSACEMKIGEPEGAPLAAFFGCIYYAATRPSEALAVHESDLQLPPTDDDWGWIRLSKNDPEIAKTWTDDGRRQARQLKHRARGEVRPVPCPPPLVALLREHLKIYGAAADGRLFRGPKGGYVKESTYSEVWQLARERALTAEEVRSPLAARPYDLRHACVSTWLAGGVDSAQVAQWAGHSVNMLHRVYAHVLTGREEVALRRIEQILGLPPRPKEEDFKKGEGDAPAKEDGDQPPQ
jgi:integrase